MKLKNIRITDPFWQEEQELVRREVIPYQWEALNDRIPGASPSFAIHNFLTVLFFRIQTSITGLKPSRIH